MSTESISLPSRPAGTRERRRAPRATPDPLLVIRFSTGNSGVVLDVSEDGLGFLASAPLPETRSVRFEIAGRSTLTSEAVGQLMWKDSSGKRAGIQFTQLPAELRTLIHRCLHGEDPPRVLGWDDVPPPPAVESLTWEERTSVLPSRTPRHTALAANLITGLLAVLVALGIWHAAGGHAPTVPRLPGRQELSKAAAAMNRSWALLAAAKPTQAAATTAAAQPLPAAPAPAPPKLVAAPEVPASPELPAPAIAASVPQASQPEVPAAAPAQAPHRSGEANAAQSAPAVASVQRNPESADARDSASAAPHVSQSPLARAQELLRNDPGPEQQAQAAQLLWQAVAKGNVAAELALAELYLAGQGVGKSCSQARVLLTTAQSHQSQAAAEKLRNLTPYGCE